MSRIDNIGQNGNTGEHYGEPLTWPISEELIGRKVRFDGYVTGNHSHWNYVIGEEYLIVNEHGDIGPGDTGGCVPPKNFENDFKFTLLPEQEIPDGYYHDDEEDKLKPLKPTAESAHERLQAEVKAYRNEIGLEGACDQVLVRAENLLKFAVPSPDYDQTDVAFKRTETDMVNHPPHYQSDGIECIDAIRASLGLEGFVAYCRGNAIEYSWRAGKKDETAQDLKKAAWYLNRAADELIKNNERTAGVNE